MITKSVDIDKRQLFITSLEKWRKKAYNDSFSDSKITNEEIDSIFAREKDTETLIRHQQLF